MGLRASSRPVRVISPTVARRLAVTRQRLAGPRPQPNGAGIMEILRDLGCLQLDPISAVERSHLLVLWSRLEQYDPSDLDRLLWEEQHLFEYWAHAASIVLTADYPLHRAYMQQWPRGNSGWPQRIRDWLAANDSFRRYVLTELRRQGPLQANQLEDRTETAWQSGGWTSHQNVRQMLNFLWMQGQIMVANRSGRARQWDLAERCLPDGAAGEPLTEREVVYRAVQKSLRALGVARAEHIRNHFIRDRYPNLAEVLAQLEVDGRLEQVEIGVDSRRWPGPWYVHSDDLALLDQLAKDGSGWQPRTTLLSPFDNLTCDRDRTETLFDFNYRSEIYVPKAKRQYGYYVMPILSGDQLIGRLDPKMDRKRARLTINAVYAEPDAPATDDAAEAIAGAVEALGEFLGAREIVYSGQTPPQWQKIKKAV